MIQGTLVELGYKEVTLSMIASSSIYIALISVILTFIQVLWFDKRVKGGNK